MSKLPRHIAVIDIGKTNVKLVLIDRADYRQIAALSRPNGVLVDGPYPHYDIDRIWQFILDGLGHFHRDHRVDGISITTHGATAVLLAEDKLALPVLDYEFDGPENLAADYAARRGDFAETLSPRLPNGLNLGAQIFWQEQAFPDPFARVSDILMYPQFWAWKLTGEKASEVTSLGTHTDLWDPMHCDFSAMVEALGWRKLFPALRPAASTLGIVRSEIAEQTGLARSTPVACGIHDSNASLLPYLGALESPFTIISSGTWTIIMSVGGATDRLDGGRDSLANVDAFGAPVPTARFMGGREFDILVGEAKVEPTANDVASVLASGAMVLPSFEAGVGPFPAAKGKWIGVVEPLSEGEQCAAASLYLALMSVVCLDLAGCGDRIIIEGPLAQNRTYCAVLAGLVDVPVHCSVDETGTSTGAAMLFAPQNSGVKLATPVVPLRDDNLASYAVKWRKLAG